MPFRLHAAAILLAADERGRQGPITALVDALPFEECGSWREDYFVSPPRGGGVACKRARAAQHLIQDRAEAENVAAVTHGATGAVRISSQLSSARAVCRRAFDGPNGVSEMRCLGEKAEGYADH